MEDWWQQVVAAGLMGVERRPIPAAPAGVPVRADATETDRLLDAAALMGAVLLAAPVPGTVTDSADAAAAATPAEERPEAPAKAAQLLQLITVQNPAGADSLEPLVTTWCAAAERHGRRLPHRLLPEMLELATRRTGLRAPIRPVLGARGEWLAGQHDRWRWAAPSPAAEPTPVAEPTRAASAAAGPDPDDWARLPHEQRVAVLGEVRAVDPGRARTLLEHTWDRDPAKARRAHLEVLAEGLTEADEPLLEAALDDRAASVREAAHRLLDRLPDSARAARMADRLRPLISTHGLLRRTIEVALPDDPDPIGVRDGLTTARHGSKRGGWLRALTRGAPLDVWTEASGAAPGATFERIQSVDAKAGIREAVILRRDAEWAEAILAVEADLDPGLLLVLPPRRRTEISTTRVQRAKPADLRVLIDTLPGPISPDLSVVLVDAARASVPQHDVIQHLVDRATHLHPACLPALQRWQAKLSRGPVESGLRQLIQFLSLTQTIDEAFT